MPFRPLDPAVERPFVDDRVRIQYQHVFAARFADARIIAAREPQVRPVFDDAHPRKVLADQLHRPVA